MTTYTSLLFAFLEGMLLGCAFFYILWLSVQKILSSKQAIPWFIGSWITRMVLAIGGLYLISMGTWHLLLASLCGFVIGRSLIARFVGVNTKRSQEYLNRATESATGAKHAP